MSKTAALILGDQLFHDLPGLPVNIPLLLAEDYDLCTTYRHHQQKLVLFLSSMRHFAQEQRAFGRTVDYQVLSRSQGGLFEHLQRHAKAGLETLYAYFPNDDQFAGKLEAWAKDSNVKIIWIENPNFLTTDEDWRSYCANAKGRLMGNFYVWQRRRLNILLEPGTIQPVGGKWSFDGENRKKLPKSVNPPAPIRFEPDATTQEVIRLVQTEFKDHPGKAADFNYGTTHGDALDALHYFLDNLFDSFGPYEDAISTESRTAFHSVLTPYLNCGLLNPAEIVESVLERNEASPVPIESLEGFIRQVIGWREFMKGIARDYTSRGRKVGSPEMNQFQFRRELKPCWYTGTTGLPPLDAAIRRARDFGWCHHIERLMVIGSAMLMAEVNPDCAFRWFMEMFIDSAEWVMLPNIYGMSQFADLKSFATKPYISGSSYLLRMSDYPKGPWCDVWDGLYWRFIAEHNHHFSRNPRMAIIVKASKKMDSARRDKLFAAAEQFIEVTTELR